MQRHHSMRLAAKALTSPTLLAPTAISVLTRKKFTQEKKIDPLDIGHGWVGPLDFPAKPVSSPQIIRERCNFIRSSPSERETIIHHFPEPAISAADNQLAQVITMTLDNYDSIACIYHF